MEPVLSVTLKMIYIGNGYSVIKCDVFIILSGESEGYGEEVKGVVSDKSGVYYIG